MTGGPEAMTVKPQRVELVYSMFGEQSIKIDGHEILATKIEVRWSGAERMPVVTIETVPERLTLDLLTEQVSLTPEVVIPCPQEDE